MESRIIRDAISGNTDALTLLINKYKDVTFNLAVGIVKNREDAKDITQDSFLKVLENIHKFRNESKFSTWLYKIVYNNSIGFLQKNKRIDKDAATDSMNSPFVTDNESNTKDYSELYNAIDRLEDKEKILIQLFYLGEKSIKEIHKITGLSISNIKVTLHRARKKLTDKLEYETTR